MFSANITFCLKTVSYTHLRAHETDSYLVCRLLLEKKKKKNTEIGHYPGYKKTKPITRRLI